MNNKTNFPRSPLILLAAGGTGGHLFPACSLARTLMTKGYRVKLLTDQRGEQWLTPYPDISYKVISTSKIHGSLLGKISTLYYNALGYFQSRRIIKEDRPGAIVGFGGFPSFPPVLAGHHLGVPVVLHEQNSVMGRANRILTRYSDVVALSFSDTSRTPVRADCEETGNPVRQDIIGIGQQGYTEPDSDKPFNLLVFGGSQGSTILSEIIPSAISALPPDQIKRLNVVQQCRKSDIDQVEEVYQRLELHNYRCETFIEDMPQQLKQADLIISRSGASTVAELTAVGRPAIYIPLGSSIEGDQLRNAKYVVERGGGWLIEEKDFTVEALQAKLEMLLKGPKLLVNAAESAKSLGHPKANENLAELVTRLTSESRGDRKEFKDEKPYDVKIEEYSADKEDSEVA